MKKELHASLKGRVKIAVLENGHVVEERPWQDNLILDQGLDKLATVYFNQLFHACCIGDGIDVTTIRPTATATASGQNLTASAPTFSNADLDSDVHFDTGQYAKIQSVTDSQHITVFTPITVSAPTRFTILRTNQAILENEVQRTVHCAVTPGANSTVSTAAAVVLQRTFLFPPEEFTVTYSEVGFSDQDLAGANLFSRVLLAQPVTVNGPGSGAPLGQQLQVTYTLTVSFDMGAGYGVPVSGRIPLTFNITGLPIIYPVFQWVNNNTGFPGKLDAYIYPPTALIPGNNAIVAGSTVANYNGTWQVLAVSTYNDPTHGPAQVLTLNTAFTSGPADANATLTNVETGAVFRPCFGIFGINSTGGSAAPSVTPDLFQGYGEPSVAGIAWISSDPAKNLGSNNTPVRPSYQVQTAGCQLLPYTNGSFYIDKQVIFTTEFTPQTAFGVGAPDQTNQIQTYVWDQAQQLGVNSLLELTFRFSWNRTTF